LASWAYGGDRTGRGEHGLSIAVCLAPSLATAMVSLVSIYWSVRRARSWWHGLWVLPALLALLLGAVGIGAGLVVL
jgi:hypothetical protein